MALAQWAGFSVSVPILRKGLNLHLCPLDVVNKRRIRRILCILFVRLWPMAHGLGHLWPITASALSTMIAAPTPW
jgi:hypothetical protein